MRPQDVISERIRVLRDRQYKLNEMQKELIRDAQELFDDSFTSYHKEQIKDFIKTNWRD